MFSARMRPGYCNRSGRRGFSLLEVILALAIFTLALTAIGELMRLGLRNAALARDTTRAQTLAESVLNELASQAIEVTPVSDQVSEFDPDFQYSIQIAPVEVAGLLSATVYARRVNSTNPNDGFTVTRWIPDPQYIAQQEAEAEANAAAEASTTTTTDPTNSPDSQQR
jgi:prepilin-type N-terminal cleavage/methylation domain-containing protein